MIKFFISVTSQALDLPPPVTNCHTISDPLPFERDVLYGRPLKGSLNLVQIPVEVKFDCLSIPNTAKGHGRFPLWIHYENTHSVAVGPCCSFLGNDVHLTHSYMYTVL